MPDRPRYPRPVLADPRAITKTVEALETIRYLTAEWLADPATFGGWAGGAYMEALHDIAARGFTLAGGGRPDAG
jgi:hypothetical protein